MRFASIENSTYRSAVRRGRNWIGFYLGVDSPEGKVLVTAANWLTLFRLVIVPFFWVTLFSGTIAMSIVASTLFILGALSDLFDGKLARRLGQQTPFGDFMDPLADKLLVLTAFWALLFRENFGIYFPSAMIMVILISFREVGITLMRVLAIEGGSSLVTSAWGKWKTGVQLTTLIATLVFLNLRDILGYYDIRAGVLEYPTFYIIVCVMFFLSMATSLASGYFYLAGGKRRRLDNK